MLRPFVVLTAACLLTLSAAAQTAPHFDRFQALIGIDDGARGRDGDGIFRVELDGKEVFKSAVLRPGNPPVAVDIPLGESQELSLIVDDVGNGHGGDWGDWLDARLVSSQTGEFLFLTDLTPEERQVWIPANRDRNIVKNKLAVDGKTYLRGWGAISGDALLFRDWNAAAAKAEAEVARRNAEAARQVGELTLRSAAAPPEGLTLEVDGVAPTADDLARGIPLKPDALLTVTADPTSAEQTRWWAAGQCRVHAGKRSVPLADLVQPTDRVIHRNVAPNRSVLVGAAPPEPQGYWCGQPLPPAGPIIFTLRDLPLAVQRATPPETGPRAGRLGQEAAGGNLLRIQAKLGKTTEVPNAAAITSAVLDVVLDGQTVAHVFTDNPDTWAQTVAISDWPNRVECVTRPGADGSVGDRCAIDLGFQIEGRGEPLWLRTVQPVYSRFDFADARRLLVAAAWEVPGSGIVRWEGLADELRARERGATALTGAVAKMRATTQPAEVNAAAEEVLKLDPKQPDVRIAAAERFKALGDLEQERRQWGLIAEDSRAELALVQQARTRSDEIWDQLDPEPIPYPDDDMPTRDARTLDQTWTGAGDFLGKIWTITLDARKNWTTTLKFPAPAVPTFGLLVNSRGVEVSATLRAASGDQTPLGQKTTIHPMFAIKSPPAGTPLVLEISLDPDITGLILTHTLEVVAWPVQSEADRIAEDWELALHEDGSATVSRESQAPVFAAIPRTATDLSVEGCAGYTVQEPITEYLVDWDGRLGSVCLPLLAVPAPGQTLRISYEWPDAAYNVPMTMLNWQDRLDHVLLRGPAGILDTTEKSRWRITEVPEGWARVDTNPAPTPEDPEVFLLDPKGALDARWKAGDVQTPWFAYSHKSLHVFFPDNANNRRWSRVMMKYVRRIWDKQLKITGHEHEYCLYVAVTGACQLSGYGGATVSQENKSETWVASTGRMAPCVWRHGHNVTGVDAHELHWITLKCRVPSAPLWTDQGFSSWLEEISWRGTYLSDAEWWRRKNTANVVPALELIRSLGYNPIQLEGDAYRNLPNDTRFRMICLGWYISDQIYEKYGEDFWGKFWAEERRLYKDIYPVLSDRARHILFVSELARVSGDPGLRDRFVKEWLFDLTPLPEDQPDRFLILPRQPRVTTKDQPEFAAADLDDALWGAASGPGGWDETVPGMAGYAGVAWFRFAFEPPADFKTENLELALGEVESADEAYLNGKLVGSTGKFPPDAQPAGGKKRVYQVPADLLQPGGRNVLAVRVFNPTSSGGLRQMPTLVSRLKPTTTAPTPAGQ